MCREEGIVWWHSGDAEEAPAEGASFPPLPALHVTGDQSLMCLMVVLQVKGVLVEDHGAARSSLVQSRGSIGNTPMGLVSIVVVPLERGPSAGTQQSAVRRRMWASCVSPKEGDVVVVLMHHGCRSSGKNGKCFRCGQEERTAGGSTMDLREELGKLGCIEELLHMLFE